MGLVRLPEIKLTKEERKLVDNGQNLSNYEFLRAITFQGFNNKLSLIDKKKIEEYKKQLDFELSLVEELSFTDYFLLVWRVINKAIELGAFIDYGRGSCAGSLIFYVLGITGVDSLDKKLYFARFISKVRAKKQIIDGITYLDGELAPDVDLNVSVWRPGIIEWLNTIYPGRMSKIIALSSLTGKVLIKDVYKTFENANEEQAKSISDLVEKNQGIVEDLEVMPDKNEEFKNWSESHSETFDICLKLRNLLRGKSVHASGYLISYDLLNDSVPVELTKDKDLVCSFAMSDACKISIKLDLLGLTSNKIIKEVLDVIPEKIQDINKKLDNDPFIYNILQNDFLPYGLYQISADTAFRVTKKVKPKNIYELSDINAIARPGAIDYIHGYAENKSPCPHKAFEKTLNKTRNYCLYQEQMMEMAITIGFSPEESEQLRRVVGKKKVEEVKLWKERVYKNCEKNGFTKEVGDILWKILEDSSRYSFNASHSISTSYLSALTVYLKYKYPVQFFTACLNNVKELPEPIEEIKLIQKELPHFGIKILPPHILKSGDKFIAEDLNIRYPITEIKGISSKSVGKLMKFRNSYSNKFEIFKAADESGLPINIFSNIIMVGSMDDMLTESRAKTLLEAHLWWLLTEKEKIAVLNYGEQYNFDLCAVVKDLHFKLLNEKNKPFISASRRQTLLKHFQPFLEIYKLNSRNNPLTQFFFEKNLIGFSYTTNLYELYKEKCHDLNSISEFKAGLEDEYFKLVGEVSFAKVATSKKGTKYFKIQLDGHDGSLNCMLFDSSNNERILDHEENNGRMAAENDVCIVRGKKKGDAMFCDQITIQKVEVVDKISELKKNK